MREGGRASETDVPPKTATCERREAVWASPEAPVDADPGRSRIEDA